MEPKNFAVSEASRHEGRHGAPPSPAVTPAGASVAATGPGSLRGPAEATSASRGVRPPPVCADSMCAREHACVPGKLLFIRRGGSCISPVGHSLPAPVLDQKRKSLLVLIHGCCDIYLDLKSMELFPREGFLRRACFIPGLLPHEGWSLIRN